MTQVYMTWVYMTRVYMTLSLLDISTDTCLTCVNAAFIVLKIKMKLIFVLYTKYDCNSIYMISAYDHLFNIYLTFTLPLQPAKGTMLTVYYITNNGNRFSSTFLLFMHFHFTVSLFQRCCLGLLMVQTFQAVYFDIFISLYFTFLEIYLSYPNSLLIFLK